MKLSFIIPTYNAIDTVGNTLDSIYATLLVEQDFEVIIVDDCSIDNTCALVEHYAQKHANLRLIRQPQNHRQGAARNRGLKEAKGDYITYIDADDLVLDGFSKAWQVAIDTKADMIYGFMEIEKPNGVHIHKLSAAPKSIMTGKEFGEAYCADGVFYYPPSYIYKRSFMERINTRFVEERQHEDRDWLASVLVQAETVAVCPYTTYRYTLNPNSTCHAPRYSTIFDHVASGIRHIDLAKQLRADCPKLSATLYAFGMEEIHHSVRLRNLTKYPWVENRCLYDENHLMPLMKDLKRVCKDNKVHSEVKIVAYWPLLTKIMVLIASPLAHLVRIVKH